MIYGLKAIHDLNIMHRDIKSANVFLSKEGVAKLGDMNVSKVANREGLNFTQTGTPYYARYYSGLFKFLALRFGETNHTLSLATSGQQGLCSMRFSVSSHHFKQMICKDSLKKF